MKVLDKQLGHRKTLPIQTNYRNLSDQKLAERVAIDDNWACIALMSRHKDSLRFEIKKMIYNQTDVESLMLQGFAKAFININKYNPKFAFSTWLFTITKNSCVDFLRSKRLKKDTFSIDGFSAGTEGSSFMDTLSANILNPEEELIKKQKAKNLYNTVAQLRPIYRAVIKLYYFQELSTAEVSKTLGMPVGRVKLYLYRARKELHMLYGTLN